MNTDEIIKDLDDDAISQQFKQMLKHNPLDSTSDHTTSGTHSMHS